VSVRVTVLYRVAPCGLVKGMFRRRDRSRVKIMYVCRSAVGLTDCISAVGLICGSAVGLTDFIRVPVGLRSD
jgi:hypothetical protein